MPHLTVAQNIFIGREPARVGLLLDEAALNAAGRGAARRALHSALDPRTRVVGDLTVAKQQMVEIAKALSFDSRRPDHGRADRGAHRRRDRRAVPDHPRASGSAASGIVYISHRLDELKQIADRVTVHARRPLHRHGARPRTRPIGRIIGMMVGRTISRRRRSCPERPSRARSCSRSRNLQPRARWSATSASRCATRRDPRLRRADGRRPHRGGPRHLRRRLAATSGEILVNGKPVTIRTPRDAVRHGIGYLSEDRKRYGLAARHGRARRTSCWRPCAQFTVGSASVRTAATRGTAAELRRNARASRRPSIAQQVKNLLAAATSRRSSSPNG